MLLIDSIKREILFGFQGLDLGIFNLTANRLILHFHLKSQYTEIFYYKMLTEG